MRICHSRLAARLAKIVMIDGAGHSPMVEKPGETLALLKSFIGGAHD